jgi:hypothetical protein
MDSPTRSRIRISKQLSHIEIIDSFTKQGTTNSASQSFIEKVYDVRFSFSNSLPLALFARSPKKLYLRYTLYKLIPLNGLIGERFYSLLDPFEKGCVKKDNLIKVLNVVNRGTIDQRLHLVFEMYAPYQV